MDKEIKKYTEMFHYTYEMLALNFGYETRKDTKKFDFDTPNGKLMYATVEKIILPILEENKKLKQQLEQRDNIINKARESIEENSLEVNTKEYGTITVVNSDDLLEILNIDKGDEL